MWKRFGAFTSLLCLPSLEITFLLQHPFLHERVYEKVTIGCTKGIFLWLPYANIFTTGPPVFVNAPFRLGKITNCSVETVSHHFSFL